MLTTESGQLVFKRKFHVSPLKISILRSNLSFVIVYLIRFVDQVSIGDELLIPEKSSLAPTKVFNISSFIMKGNYYLQYSVQKKKSFKLV